MGDVFVTVPKGVKPYVRFVPYDLEAPVFKDQLLGILEAGPVSDPNALKKHPVYALEGVARRRSFSVLAFRNHVGSEQCFPQLAKVYLV